MQLHVAGMSSGGPSVTMVQSSAAAVSCASRCPGQTQAQPHGALS